MRLVITGASGFIGQHLVALAAAEGLETVLPPRGRLGALDSLLAPGDAVVHLAGLAQSRGADAARYDAVNRRLPVELARAAQRAGARRFVFVSTSHVATRPETPYAAAKAAAESGLAALGWPGIVIARPAPVYGPGGRGNIRAMLALAHTPLPLPLAGAKNRLSLLHVDNAAGALLFLATAAGVEGRTFFLADPGPPLPLAEIIAVLRRAMGREPRLFFAPWLPGLLTALGQGGRAGRLLGESVVDGAPLLAAGWRPALDTPEGLARLAAGGGR